MERATAGMQGLRDRIRDTWDGLEDSDIDRTGGSLDKLVELIARKTGRPRTEVRREVRRLFAG